MELSKASEVDQDEMTRYANIKKKKPVCTHHYGLIIGPWSWSLQWTLQYTSWQLLIVHTVDHTVYRLFKFEPGYRFAGHFPVFLASLCSWLSTRIKHCESDLISRKKKFQKSIHKEFKSYNYSCDWHVSS